MTNKRALEKRLAELRGDVPADGGESFTIREEVVETPWEPAADGEAPSAGTTVTRYYRTEAGGWTAEDGGEDYDE